MVTVLPSSVNGLWISRYMCHTGNAIALTSPCLGNDDDLECFHLFYTGALWYFSIQTWLNPWYVELASMEAD